MSWHCSYITCKVFWCPATTPIRLDDTLQSSLTTAISGAFGLQQSLCQITVLCTSICTHCWAGQSKLGASLEDVYAGMDMLTGMVSGITRLAQHKIEDSRHKDSRGQAVCKRQSQCCTEEGTEQVRDTEHMLCRMMPDWRIPKHLKACRRRHINRNKTFANYMPKSA